MFQVFTLTSVTDMKPDNFRAEISFSAVLTCDVSAPDTHKETYVMTGEITDMHEVQIPA